MSRGLMLFALSDTFFSNFEAEVDADTLWTGYKQKGRILPNAMHFPVHFDYLLDLDVYLRNAGYPNSFSYNALLCGGIPIKVSDITDYPMLGWIPEAIVKEAVTIPRQWIDDVEDQWSASALEELFEVADQASILECGIAGVYQ
jgi:hypothetical protein